jgi:hypothetical protein
MTPNLVHWNGVEIDLNQETQLSREFLDYIDPVQPCGHRASDIRPLVTRDSCQTYYCVKCALEAERLR